MMKECLSACNTEKRHTRQVELSERVINNIEKIIRRESKVERFKQTRKVLSKVAVIALIVISVVFTAMMSVSAIRTAIWEIITEWYEEYIAIGYEPEEGYGVVEPPKMIEEIRKPTLLPLGAEEEIGVNLRSRFSSDYYIGDECYVSFKQSLLTNHTSNLDGEGASVEEIMIGKHQAWLFTYENKDYVYIVWNDSEYSYQISSMILSIDELLLIAESIK